MTHHGNSTGSNTDKLKSKQMARYHSLGWLFQNAVSVAEVSTEMMRLLCILNWKGADRD
jgi:hypothetical protein